jgi:flagellar motor protein MotB
MFRMRSIAAASLAAGLLACAGCDSSSSAGTPAAGAPVANEPSAADCDKIAQVPPPAGKPPVALVVDNTASQIGHPLPDGLLKKLGDAQHAGQPLVIVAVDGQSPSVVRTAALDPSPGKDSKAGDNARAEALRCVNRWAHATEALPKHQGSDVLEALNAASRQHPSAVYVVSDGLGNTGAFNIDAVGFDAEPQELATSLREADALAPTLNNLQITWYELGESAKPLPQAARTSLQNLWQATLKSVGTTVTFDLATGGRLAAPSGLPADDVSIPEAATVTSACGTRITVPAALLFHPGSAELQPDAADVLKGVAGTLNGHPDWSAKITGHTADYGTADSRKQLSVQRAGAVRDFLAGAGIDRSRLAADGVGATQPAVPEIVGGRHDLAAAAKNRRVVIEIGPGGCGS